MFKKRFLAAATALCLAAPTVTSMANAANNSAFDLNGDGEFTVSDVVLLQKYLMGANVKIANGAADIIKDGRIDAFDLCALRDMLAKKLVPISKPAMKHSVNISADYEPTMTDAASPDSEFILGQTKFALEMLQNSLEEGENTFISPTSAVYALAMTANGADGETRKQMEQVIGSMPIEQLNKYLFDQRTSLPDRDKCSVKIANAMWKNTRRSEYEVLPEFLQTNKNYYNADIFEGAFSDDVKDEINQWSNDNTDGMIPKIIDILSPDSIMCLLNAVLFEAEWEYKINSLYDYQFTNFDGSKVDRQFMNGSANSYISGEHGVGVCKYYSGRDYAFAAILPEEGMSTEEYIASLTPEELNSILKNREEQSADLEVSFNMPTFELDDDIDLGDILIKMGMVDAFDEEKADFTKMFDKKGAMITDVFQKTHIAVDNNGTKAAAVTAVIIADNCAPMEKRYKHISFDRPFVYMIIDTKTNIPVFIGDLNVLE